jgi:pyruvate/2-oxoglutarate dehydrogenase complex dihydrolipoamide dehydrogenase (E3) component
VAVDADGATRLLTADRVVISTGLSPVIPPIDGLDTVPFLTSSSIMELTAVPEHLVVIGGGVIGLEFGQMFRRFGAQVTILQRAGRLVPREDDDVSSAIREFLEEDGVRVITDAEVTRVGAHDGAVEVEVEVAGSTQVAAGSHLLVATGRRPNIEALDLAVAGVRSTRRGHVKVNSRLETNVPGVFAIGDVTGGPAFTHMAYDDFRILRTNLLDGGKASTRGRLVPYTMFTDPQLGRVGMTEREARKAGREVRVATLPMAHVARAIETDEMRGFMKAVVDAKTHRILGAAILGVEGGEVASVLQVAMMGRLPWQRLRDSAFSHPTFSEALNNLFMTL